MAFLAPAIAPAVSFIAKPLVKWGIVAIVIGALFGLWRWERHDRIAAEKGESAAKLESGLHEADATRWQTAAEARLAQIVGLSDQMTRQNAEIKATAAARDRAEQRAAGAATQAAKAQSDLNDLTLKWKERGHAHPEDVGRLAPAACDAYRVLYGAAKACTHPGGAAAD